jgi:hypothetical protein
LISCRSRHFPYPHGKIYTLDSHELCRGVSAHAQTAGAESFELKKVGDGVWAAVAAVRYKVNSNAAVIETNDGQVIVDTHSKPSAAQALYRDVQGVTKKTGQEDHQHALSLGPLAGQPGLRSGQPGAGDHRLRAHEGTPRRSQPDEIAEDLASTYETPMSKHPLGRYRDRIDANVEQVYNKIIKKS